MKLKGLYFTVGLCFLGILAFYSPTNAEPMNGCAPKRLVGGFCDAYNTVPFRDDYCKDPVPSGSGCCCTPEAMEKINNELTTSSKKQETILPSFFKAPDLKVAIPGLSNFKPVTCDTGNCYIPWLAEYVAGLQRYAIAIIGLLAVIVIMIGGITWLTAGGNQTRIGDAKKFIASGVGGVVLTICAYLLLYTINPDLTVLKSLQIRYIEKVDLSELMAEIKDGEPISQEDADLMNSLDTQGLVKHTVGKSANTYKSQSCNKSIFNGGAAVEFFTTGYYKPGPWKDDWSFFCDVGLQCSCPPGVKQLPGNKALCKHKYKYCDKFPQGTPYCTQNAAGHEPRMGEIAADGDCFNTGDKVCLGGKITLTVADRGSAIKGRRFDIWSGTSRENALANTGVASITLGPCQ